MWPLTYSVVSAKACWWGGIWCAIIHSKHHCDTKHRCEDAACSLHLWSVVELQKCSEQNRELVSKMDTFVLYFPGCDYKTSPTVLWGAGCGSRPKPQYLLSPEKQLQSSKPVSAAAHCTQIVVLCSNTSLPIDGGMGFPSVFWAPAGATNFGYHPVGGPEENIHPAWLGCSEFPDCYNSLLTLLCCFCVIAWFFISQVNLIVMSCCL